MHERVLLRFEIFINISYKIMYVYLIIQSIFPATVLRRIVSYRIHRTNERRVRVKIVGIIRLLKDGMIIHEPNKQLDLIIIGVVPPSSSFNKNIPLTIWSLLVLLVRVLCTPPPPSWKHQQ